MKPMIRRSAMLAQDRTSPDRERLLFGLCGLAAVLLLQLISPWFH